MYDYASLKRTESTVLQRAPVDNMRINGTPIEDIIQGYRQLTVKGRSLLNREISTTRVPGRRGVWVDSVNDSEREIEVKYQLTTVTSQVMRTSFRELNRILREVGPSGYLEVTFDDEPDFTYYAIFKEAEEVEEDRLSVISSFVLLVPDGYKKRVPERSNGIVYLTYAKKVIPEKIVAMTSTASTEFEIINGQTKLSFKGSYAANKEIVIKFGDEEVTATYDGRNILSELQRFSPLEQFYVKDGDRLTGKNAIIREVQWRDESL